MISVACPPPFSLWESRDQVVSQWERVKPQNNCENQHIVALVCDILSVISVFDIETCLSYTCHMCLYIKGQNKYGVFPSRCVCVSVCVLVKPATATQQNKKWNCGKTAEQKVPTHLWSQAVVLMRKAEVSDLRMCCSEVN